MEQSKSHQASKWAKKHRPLAIASIIIAKLGVTAIGLVLGCGAWLGGFSLANKPLGWLLFSAALTGILAYPSKSLKPRIGLEAFYLWQKRGDAFMAVFGFVFFFYMGNISGSWAAQAPIAPLSSTSIEVALSSIKAPQKAETNVSKQQSLFKRWGAKFMKRKINRIIQKIERSANERNEGEKVVMLLLMVFLAAGLLYAIVGFSCSLSCSGQESLAAVVLIGGLVGVVTLFILGAWAIYRKKKPKPPVPD